MTVWVLLSLVAYEVKGVSTLRWLSFLAPVLEPVYREIGLALGQDLGLEVQVEQGQDYSQLDQERVDLVFLCSLPHLQRSRGPQPAYEAVAAPVLQGSRYGGKPIYYSDVIVHEDSPYRRFEDLRGARWVYNETLSQSGYGIVRYKLIQMGETAGFFGEVLESGFHERSIEWVRRGRVDASAIDSHVLAMVARTHPEGLRGLRAIDSLGPSTIQPLAASRDLPTELVEQIGRGLASMHKDPASAAVLSRGLMDRFVRVGRNQYGDILDMLELAEQVGFQQIR